MKKCNVCGSIYKKVSLFGEYDNGCPMCNNSYSPVSSYHGGLMEMKKYGKAPDAHKHIIHLGVELETEYPSETDKFAAARDVFRILNKKTQQYVKLERDGSLCNGFEIITQPIQIGLHKYSMQWKKAFEVMESHGGTSHNSGRCGLHIHLDKYSEGFQKNIWNLVNKVYREDLQLFSRRNENQMRYCAFDNNSYENRITGHCVAVNTSASTGRTVEIRIFRGTLKYETFIETLSLVTKLAWIALENEDVMYPEKKLPKFDTLLTPYGKKYMKERRERGAR